VKRLCKEEYGLDVEGRIIGTTLGVSIPIEGLVAEDLKLDKDAADKIEDLALSMRRVILSTDRPIDFYVLCARDTEMIGAEYVMTGYAMDIKRVILRDISRGQYLSRMERDFRLSPAILGEYKIKKLFEDLSKGASPGSVLPEYVHFPVLTDRVREIFYPAIFIAEPSSIKYEISELKYKEVSEGEALFWIKVKEHYEPKPGAEKGASIFPPGFTNEYLILVNRADQSRPIAQILPAYFDRENTIQRRVMGQMYDRYEDFSMVDSGGLPSKEIELTGFLAKQIARRLKERLEYEEPFKDDFQIAYVKGRFEEDTFILSVDIQGDEKEIFTQALAMLRDITRGCWFEDFEGVEVKSETSGRSVTLSREELRKTGKEKIEMEKYLSFD